MVIISLVGEGWKTLAVGHRLKVFSTIQEKQWPGTFAILAPRLCNRYNHAHVPGPHMWPSPGRGPDSKAPKQWKSDVHVKSKTLSVRDRH